MENDTVTDNLHRRLRKIAGQVQAIDRMVESGAPCDAVLVQINAAKSALHKAGQILLEDFLATCVREGAGDEPEETVARYTDAVKRFCDMD